MKKFLLAFSFLTTIFWAANAQGPITTICLVTVDSASTHNIIVWEKADQIATTAPIDSIRIYRTSLVGQDSLVGAVHWDSLSQFHDYSVNVNARPYRYRIAGVDSLGNVGPMSFPHQTMHFKVLDNLSGNLHLVWTPYIGQSITTYECYRDSNGFNNMDWVFSQTPNDTSWWDNNTPSNWTNLWYFVDVAWSLQCVSTRANHNTTRSNRTQPIGGEVGIADGPTLSEFAVFPNPSNGIFKYVFSSTAWEITTIDVYDVNGRKVHTESPIRMLGQYNGELDLTNQPSGVYTLRISNGYTTISKRLLLAE